jgi:biotin-dependent carboxylase-like uncharacterized protein
MIEILTSGLMNSVQDLGRTGLLNQGIGRGGAMDRTALVIANRLVGNDDDLAGIEVSIFPFRLRTERAVLVAVTGCDSEVTINGRGLPPWWTTTIPAGGELRLSPPRTGARAYIALAGGIDCPQVQGSRATDLKSGFGGHRGAALMRGDRLALISTPKLVQPLQPAGHGADPNYFRDGFGGRTGNDAQTIRIMTGAEYEAFSEEAKMALHQSVFSVSSENNRQGMRLEGPALTLTDRLELHSHGIMPGTIQVPPSGQAVIQLAEANTCGGYPKIAHVIEADLWKLAQAPSGSKLRFEIITRSAAIAAERLERQKLARLGNLMPLALNAQSGAG